MNDFNKKLDEIFSKEYQYQGNCKNSFDDSGNCLIPLFRDTSDFAVVEDESIEISREEFLKIVPIQNIPKPIIGDMKSPDTLYLQNKERDILMIYDSRKDIHYFFK